MTIETDIFGYLGGLILSINSLPQIYKIWKTKSTNDLSYTTFFIALIGYVFYIIYGTLIKSIPIITGISFSFVCTLSMICLKYSLERIKENTMLV